MWLHDLVRILFVGARSSYMNPTEELLPEVLARVGTVTAVGPGYGGETWPPGPTVGSLRALGPFDAIVLDTSATLLAIEPNRAATSKAILQVTATKATYHGLMALAGLVEQLPELRIPIVASLVRLDPHAWQAEWETPLLELADAFLGLDPMHAPSDLESAAAATDPMFGVGLSRNYYDFAEVHRSRLVPWPHFVSRSVDPSVDRSTRAFSNPRWAVPGVPYAERLEALQQLKRAGIQAKGSLAYRSVALSYRINRGQTLATQIARLRYSRLLRWADVALVSGSSLRLPVRKFFEVPGSGCLMAAVPFNSMEALGFNPYEHYVPVNPTDPSSVHSWLCRYPDEAAAIANRGTDLVWRAHSDEARARMLAAFLRVIQDRPTVRWRSGTWTIE